MCSDYEFPELEKDLMKPIKQSTNFLISSDDKILLVISRTSIRTYKILPSCLRVENAEIFPRYRRKSLNPIRNASAVRWQQQQLRKQNYKLCHKNQGLGLDRYLTVFKKCFFVEMHEIDGGISGKNQCGHGNGRISGFSF